MREVKNVPELRFSEFESDWLSFKLGDISKFSKGKGISKADIDEMGNTECIRYGQLYTEYGEVIDNVISRTKVSSENLVLSKKNDVIIPASGETSIDIATASCVQLEGIALGGDLNIIRTEQNGAFLAYYLNNKKKTDIAKFAQGNSVVHLYGTQLSLLSLNLPSNNEQQKIADFLSSMDKKIEQLTEKHSLLTEYKKGVMQQIFTQQIRFKDNQGNEYPEWEEKSLCDVAKFSKGKDISKSDIVAEGKLPCIRYGELYTHYQEVINKPISSTNLNKDSLILSVANDVIIPASGETNIDIATASCVLNDGIALSGDLNIIRGKFNGVFLAYYLNSHKRFDIARLAQGNSVVHLYNSQLGSLKVLLPCLEEQQKIANFLTQIDQKIDQARSILEQTTTFKKGLLQKMFV